MQVTIGFWPGLDLTLRLSAFGQDLTSQFVPFPSAWQLTAFGQVLISQFVPFLIAWRSS